MSLHNRSLDSQSLDNLMQKMWVDYCEMNPAAKKIYDLFTNNGERVLNDHIAFRTFDHQRLGINSLARHFIKYGYVDKGEYFFEEKKLYAKHYEHPDKTQPKIFISELELKKCSPFIQKSVEDMVAQIKDADLAKEDFCIMGRPWKMDYKTYAKLAEESEYASWVAAYGFRPNHFTVNVNALKNFPHLQDVNQFLKTHHFTLNKSGGEIKGTPEVFLEQSSTMAAEVPVKFTDGSHNIPGCYYEFAKRYKLPNGDYYQGFVAKSADKIFESTNRLK